MINNTFFYLILYQPSAPPQGVQAREGVVSCPPPPTRAPLARGQAPPAWDDARRLEAQREALAATTPPEASPLGTTPVGAAGE